MTFQKEFDVLFAAILTDWRNQFPEADVSPGTLIYMKSACLASALWGLYKHQDWIARQIFPDTADTEFLERHAWVRGISRTVDETDAAYLARLLDYIRRPPAGGNRYDYIKWAMSFDYVAAAYCFPLAQGLGTVDVVIIADKEITGSELPSSYADLYGTVTALAADKLIDTKADFEDEDDPVRIGDLVVNDALGTSAKVTAIDSATELSLDTDIFTVSMQDYTIKALTTQVKDYIDDVRPVTASSVRVLAPTITTQAVEMAITGAGINKTQIGLEISAYLNSLTPGETLYVSRLIAIAIDAGAANAVVSVPVADVEPVDYEMLRPGTITVT